jgi:hypothetical protein
MFSVAVSRHMQIFSSVCGSAGGLALSARLCGAASWRRGRCRVSKRHRQVRGWFLQPQVQGMMVAACSNAPCMLGNTRTLQQILWTNETCVYITTKHGQIQQNTSSALCVQCRGVRTLSQVRKHTRFRAFFGSYTTLCEIPQETVSKLYKN